jgi:tRNA pseudouridine38-40 synthase
MTRKLALLTEYDGTLFNGWQAQAKGRTVQQTLLKAIWELTGEDDLNLVGSSRTDAGVHARGHVSHFTTASTIPCDRLPLALNSHLPPDIAIRSACEVPADFHAQYSAQAKIYTYHFWVRRSRPALDRLQASHITGLFDVAAMQAALPALLGRHDFTAFMDAGSCERNPIRTIRDLSLTTTGPLTTLTVCGDGFLYHMVRILAGTLLAVGQHKLQPEDIPRILAGCDRKQAGKTMPPQGLCLERVLYNPPLFEEEGEPHA